MYQQYYGLAERPFTITPNPRFVYLSPRHRDALAHLLYGVGQGGSGGFVQLTGEVGTGKTTLCRVALEQAPENTHIALLLNPMLSPAELLQAICHELGIAVEDEYASLQSLQKKLNAYLLERHAKGDRVVLIVDEAQNMSREGLEQIRLLTNLETATDKLLQIILIGQPELREVLARQELRQLAQRITARFHLEALNAGETEAYVRHRLEVAGSEHCPFTPGGLRALHTASGGIPRLINIIADRALMAGYARDTRHIGARLVRAAAAEISGDTSFAGRGVLRGVVAAVALALVLVAGGGLSWLMLRTAPETSGASAGQAAWQAALDDASPGGGWVEMATLWPGFSAFDVEQACRGEMIEGLVCLHQRGSWSYLERVDLPLILRLVEPFDARVLLVALEPGSAVLRHQGQDWRVPLRELERRWHGEVLIVWPDSGNALKLDDSGPAVEHAKQLAAQLETDPWTGPASDVYDKPFRRWVIRFQRRNGLEEDGVIGPETRLFLRYPQKYSPVLLSDSDGV